VYWNCRGWQAGKPDPKAATGKLMAAIKERRWRPAFYITFALWLAALGLTLFALIPQKWTVDPTILKQDPKKLSKGLGIEDFFEQSAAHKRRLIVFSSVLFFTGIVGAAFTISP
jgi:hypothetical protein